MKENNLPIERRSLLLIFALILKLNLVSTQRIQPRIVSGQTTTQTAVGGYVVNIRYDGSFYCGGTLVRPRHVVTAAHCIYQLSIERITVQGGVIRLSDTGIIRRVQKAMWPRSFDINRMNMDVAVLRLQSDMTGTSIRTIPLCTDQWRLGDYVRVSGWGTTSQNTNKVSNQLRTVKLRLIKKNRCKYAYRNNSNLMASTFCAYAPGKDTCSGDSGSGVIYKDQLCGIVSWVRGCAARNYPGVYTSIHRTRAFIVSSLRK